MAAGSQAIGLQALREGHLQSDTVQAQAQAQQTIAANPSVTGEVSATTAGVSVTVARHVETILLGLVGIHTLTIHAHATLGEAWITEGESYRIDRAKAPSTPTS